MHCDVIMCVYTHIHHVYREESGRDVLRQFCHSRSKSVLAFYDEVCLAIAAIYYCYHALQPKQQANYAQISCMVQHCLCTLEPLVCVSVISERLHGCVCSSACAYNEVRYASATMVCAVCIRQVNAYKRDHDSKDKEGRVAHAKAIWSKFELSLQTEHIN
jgi:hypothetical protein